MGDNKMEFKCFSSRQKKIIVSLIKAEDFVTVKELSEKLEVSERTVHRELANLKELLENSDLSLASKPGVGISIAGEKELLNSLELSLENDSPAGALTPQERRQYIIQEFLLGGRFQKLTALAYKFSVTEATISYDVKQLTDWFKERGLSLERKPGIGVELTGSETAFRRAVLDFLYQNVGESDMVDLIQDNLTQNRQQKFRVKQKILNFIHMDDISKLETAVENVLAEAKFDLVESSYIGLIMHLALAIKRLQMGETIYIDQEKLEDLKPTAEYKIAQQIVERLRDLFSLSIPEEEIGYITMHLKGAKLRNKLKITDPPLEAEELESIKLARILVEEVEERLGVELSNDFDLISGLVTHLEPVMSRLKMGMEIRNPVLPHLKKEYKEIFAATKQGAEKMVDLIGENIPEAEVGFLTMHIAAAVESATRAEEKIRVLVVCSSGIGSSKILATRLRKTIDRIEIVDEISAFSLQNNQRAVKEKDIDLIISTISLENHQEQTVVVSPILLPEEIEKIQNKIDSIEINQGSVQQKSNFSSQPDPLTDRLQTMSKISRDIINIIDNFRILNLSSVENYSEVIKRVCTSGFLPVEFNFQQIKEALVAREQQGVTIIPEIQLSLLHARTKGVDELFIGLIALEQPVQIPNSQQKMKGVDRIVVLLAPQDLLTEERKLISKFSASMIENNDFYEVVQRADEQEFIAYIRKIMGDYYQSLVS